LRSILFCEREFETKTFQQQKVDNSGLQNTGFQGVSRQGGSPDIISNPQKPPTYQAQFGQSAQPTIQYTTPTNYVQTPQPSAPQPEPPHDDGEVKPWWSALKLTPKARTILLIVAALLVLVGGGVAAFLALQSRTTPKTADNNALNTAVSFDVQQLPLSEFSAGTLPTIQGTRKLSINGQLEVHNSLIIAPTGQPSGAVAGQIYYDKDTNLLSYFNGDEFITVPSTDETVKTVGGLSGTITVGSGLAASGGQLTNTGVLDVQATGPLTSTGGQTPNVSFASGTAAGQYWQWNGSSWELATLPAQQSQNPDGDNVVGNEVTDVVTGGGLIIRGSATAADPLKVSMEECPLNEVLKSNGFGGWSCAPDAGGTTYSAGNGLNLDGTGQFSVNSPTCGGTDKLQWNGNAFVCSPDVDTDTNTTYSAGTGLSLSGTTFNNTGTLSVTASGPVTSTGGQNPNLTFANGTANGQFWQWNGSAWQLALLPGEQDSVIGNEVLNATAGQGLARSGAGSALDPFTLGLQSCTNGQILKSTGSGWSCAADGDDGSVAYSADGEGIILDGTTFRLALDGTSLSKSASGLKLNTTNANTWAASQTFGAGLVVGAGQSVTLNGDVITDLTGTGLTVAGGALQTTLGTSVDLSSEVVGTLPIANGGTGLTALGSAHQLLGVNGAGTALQYKDIGGLVNGGTGISVSGTNVVTVSNSGVLSVLGSGPVTSTGGQNPSLTFANGTSNGQFWQWNGSAWALAFLPAEQDAVIGNEVVGGTGSNSGLTRSGTGTAGNPYTLAVNTGSGLQVTTNAVGINSPTCSGTDKLQWNGSAFVCSADVDTDTNTTYSTISNGGLRLVGTQFGLGVCAAGEVLKATAVSGEYACGADNNTTYSADGNGLELTGTTFGLELNGTSLSKGASGLSLNVANANTWTGAQTFNAGATIGSGQTLSVNGDSISDFTGTGLTVNTGSLQTTLGTSVDLTSEVVGTLPVGNGGTGLTALGTSNQLLGVNSGGTALEYKNLSSLLVAGTGIGLSGTNTVTVSNSGVLSVAGSGPVSSTGGQTPTLTFANGTSAGQFWQWDGSAWQLATLPAEQDAVIGNEVTGGTGVNSGLVRSGSGTGASPYTLAVNPGNGLQVASNTVGINSPTCSGTDKLQWNGTAFVCSADVDTDTNTTYSTISNGGLRLVGTQFGLGICTQNQILKATAVSGEYACAADNDTTYTADGNGIELSGTTFSLELNGTSLNKTASGLAINLGNANTWTARQTLGAGATITTGQSLTVNGEAFTDLTGTGLAFNAGVLDTTLGTSVSLTSEVTGTLPVANGGTNLTSLGSANQILSVNGTATALQYANMAAFLTAGTGIGLSGTSNVTVSNSGVLSVAGSGAISSTGGQNPTITFANGSSTGQFWQWNGSSWALSTDLGTNVSCNVGGSFACMGGNTPSGTMTLGTTNAQSLAFKTNNNTVATVGTDGATAFKNSTNSTAAFKIQNAASNDVLNVDTTTPNMITNASFETNTTGWVAMTGNTAGDPTIARDTTQAMFGAASMKITTNADINEGAKYPVTLSPSTQYTLTFNARVSAGSFSTISVGRADVSGTDISCLTSQQINSSWGRYSCTFTTGSTITNSYIFIKQSDATARNWFIDAVQIQTGSTATPYREGAIAIAAPVTIGSTTPTSSSYGLTIRGYAEGGLNNNSLFTIQAADGTDKVIYNEQYGRLSVTGGSAFWGSGALEVQGGAADATAVKLRQYTGQTADVLQFTSVSAGTPTRYSIGAGDYTDTSGSKIFNLIAPNFNPTSSSTASFTGLAVNPIINFAGGGAGNSTALLVNPTYTAAPSGTNLLMDLQNGGTSVMNVNRTGTTLHKTTTNSTAAFSVQDASGNTPFSVDTTNDRVGVNTITPQTALDVTGSIQQTGMTTPDTGAGSAGQWTKLGTCTITAQYRECFAVIQMVGGYNGTSTSNTQATVAARVKQQNALGGVPYVNLTLNGTAEVITKDDIKAVTTQNDGSATVVQLWVRVTLDFETLNYTPIININNGTKWAWNPGTAYQAALPTGTQTSTNYGDTYANTLTLQPATDSLTSMVVKAGGSGNEVLRVDTTNERVAIGVVAGAPSAKLHVATGTTVGLRVYQSGSSDALQLANATADFLTVGSTGQTTFKNTTNSTSAFRILKADSSELLSVDSTNGRITVGKVAGGSVAGAKIYFGDYGGDIGNIFIGESGTSDTDIMELHGLGGLSFTTNGAADNERMFIDDAGVQVLGDGSFGGGGRLHFGDPGQAYLGEYGTGDSDGLQLNGRTGIYFGYNSTNRVKLDSAGLSVADNIETPTKQYRMRTSGSALDFEAGGAALYLSNWSGAGFTGTQYTGLILYNDQSRMDFKSTYTYFNPTTSPSGDLVDFNRAAAGTILGFALNGTIQGSISVSGTTVSYNAFTGSHYTWSDQNLQRGELVRMTGENHSRPGTEEEAEPTYGVERTTTANDPAVMGSYMGRMNPELPFDMFDNPNLTMAVGNGDMWVVDDGQDIEPGDFLISSDTVAHAMKDEGQFPTSYVVARAAQKVTWSGETAMINGKKHKKISVLYGSFVKTNLAAMSQGVFNGGLVAGDTTFNGLATFSKAVSFLGDATFNGNVTFKKNVTFSSNTAGTQTIAAGQKTATVHFSRSHDGTPVVNVTPQEFVSGSYRVKDVSEDQFTIELSQAQAGDVHFNWSALDSSTN
jgi:hypothetical protein